MRPSSMQLCVVLRKGLDSSQWPMTLAGDGLYVFGRTVQLARELAAGPGLEDSRTWTSKTWLQEAAKNKEVGLFKIAGLYNMADLSTKHLGRTTLDRHVTNIGLRDA